MNAAPPKLTVPAIAAIAATTKNGTLKAYGIMAEYCLIFVVINKRKLPILECHQEVEYH